MEFKKVKIVVTVPLTHADIIRKAMGDAGTGKQGNYSHCSTSILTTGRFLPLHGANPYIGSVGKPEEVKEERIEVTCDYVLVSEVLAAMKLVHPYEEVAYDVYPLLDF
jgi:hypothetical protein